MREAMHFLRQNKLAVIVSALASLFTLMLWRQTQHFPFALFIVAVVFSAWQAGHRAALLTTLFSTAVLALICFSVPFSDAVVGAASMTRLLVFVVLGGVAAFLARECLRGMKLMDQAHALVSSVRDAVIFTDATGSITRLNLQAQTLVGWHGPNALGQPLGLILQLRHESSGKAVDEFTSRVLQEKESIEFPNDVLVISSRGVETPIEGGAAALVDAARQVTGMVITLRDVTRRRHADNMVRQREQHLRALAAKAHETEESARQFQQDYEKLLADKETLQKSSAESSRSLREEYETKLREHELARNAAEQAHHDAADSFERVRTDERANHQKQMDSLQQSHQDVDRRLAAAMSQQLGTDDALRRAGDNLAAQADQFSTERARHEEALRQAREELEQRTAADAEALAARDAPLREQLAQSESRREEIRQACLRLEAALDHCPAAVCLRDAAGHMIHINRRFELQFEMRKENVLGRPGHEVLPQALAQFLQEVDRQMLDKGDSPEAHQEVVMDLGSRCYRIAPFSVRDSSAALVALGFSAADVTDQKCAEQLLVEQSAAFEASTRLHREKEEFHERLIETCDIGIFAFDRECRFTLWNPAMERIAGFEKGKVLGKLVFEVFPVLEETGESRHFLEVLDGKEVHTESKALSLDGRRALLQQTLFPTRVRY